MAEDTVHRLRTLEEHGSDLFAVDRLRYLRTACVADQACDALDRDTRQMAEELAGVQRVPDAGLAQRVGAHLRGSQPDHVPPAAA